MIALIALILSQDPTLGVEIRPEIGRKVYRESEFGAIDASAVRLDAIGPGKPLLVVPVYYRCPMLCGQALEGLARSLKAVSLRAGTDFAVVAASFDPGDTAATARERRESLRTAGYGTDGWTFLHGREPEIRRLMEDLGFGYRIEGEGRIAHGSAVYVLTPEGRISACLTGIEFPPRDLQLALVEAGQGRIGRWTDRILLLCLEYDPSRSRYTLGVLGIVRAGGVGTALLLGLLVARALRRERRKAAA